MTLGEKLKKLRHDNDLTQEQFAEKIFVTRTAVSKWETGNGYPGIDSLKIISNTFGVSIDDLVSDADIENKKLLDEMIARKFYFVAIAFLILTTLFALLTYFLKQKLFCIGSIICVVGYVFFAVMAKPRYKRLQARKAVVTYIISRVVITAVLAGVIVYALVDL